MHADLYADGVSAMDTTSGVLTGRPFGGFGIVWRKSIVTIIGSWALDLIMAIANFSPLIYIICLMTTCPGTAKIMTNVWATYLGMVHSIIQESDVSSVYVIGDWNADINANYVFGSELSSFCTEHRYVISDIEHMGIDSDSFTYISEAYGYTSWIDHCVCTGQAHVSISAINVIYDTQSSDHIPLSICIDFSIVSGLDMHGPDSQFTLNWGKASDSEQSAYTDKCSELLGNIHLPREAVCCSLVSCEFV